jgi:hypothetical protein
MYSTLDVTPTLVNPIPEIALARVPDIRPWSAHSSTSSAKYGPCEISNFSSGTGVFGGQVGYGIQIC